MGSAKRLKPKFLGKKLRILRLDILGLSQTEMSKALGLKVDYSAVSGYERGKREPPLPILLKYARLGKVTMEQLVDDKLKLPK
ncbi:MAG TPA: helix-turn-helix transcriptional regulator [Pyrinomonadaceae bacterium]|nr:helix-turn-helix transcriptional regulator [Pyrinomonadaceae bacterium]